ncbi:hypothetical protein R6Q59_009998 [Mikania micrantha]
MTSIRANCRKVICIGRNYADHIKELNNKPPFQPFFFLKPSSSILSPPHDNTPITIPRGVKCHYEVELGLIIGHSPSSSSSTPSTPLRNLRFPSSEPEATNEARKYIAGYVLAIDLTARNVQDEAKKKGLPWSTAKGFDTFLPLSNVIPAHEITDPHNVGLKLEVNGMVKQSDSTELMLFRIPRILSDVSKVMSLEEGDIVLTGTPKGVGQIVAGDKVVCELEVSGKARERFEIGVVDGPSEEEGGFVFRET